MNGEVQIYVNGEPEGDKFNLMAGDSVLYTMPGQLLNGRVAIAEASVKTLEERVRGWSAQAAKLGQAIREMAEAATLDEAIGIAYRSGALREDL